VDAAVEVALRDSAACLIKRGDQLNLSEEQGKTFRMILTQNGACSSRSEAFFILAKYLFDQKVLYCMNGKHAFCAMQVASESWVRMEFGGEDIIDFVDPQQSSVAVAESSLAQTLECSGQLRSSHAAFQHSASVAARATSQPHEHKLCSACQSKLI
jgi:hypothetical protein